MAVPSHFVLVCVVFLSMSLCAGDDPATTVFEWRTSGWSTCEHRDLTKCCDQCFKKRNVTCALKGKDVEVPPFYCIKLSLPKPDYAVKCDVCEQDCVVSLWSYWSRCSAPCPPATRYRTRSVLLPPSRGGKTCGPLSEIQRCDNLPECEDINYKPQFTWKVGPWTSCRQRGNESETSCSGIRWRQVRCLNRQGSPVWDKLCEVTHKGKPKPLESESCVLPCDCKVSDWSPWGTCSKTCWRNMTAQHNGLRVRERLVERMPRHGGLQCPPLRDTRPCDANDVPACPRYVWRRGDWGDCTMSPSDRSMGKLCGSGMKAAPVYCALEGDPKMTPVADRLCVQDQTVRQGWVQKPASRRACMVPCPQDCQLGEWTNWSACTKSCGFGGTKTRRKPIVVPAKYGGKECSPRFEYKVCEDTPCSWWHTGQWSRCLPPNTLDPKACGNGTQVRNVYCMNSLDEVLPEYNCSTNQSKPVTQRQCYAPCPGECVLSQWSSWTPCSARCGPQGGIQHRNRSILVPGNGSSPCLPDEQLRQTRTCNRMSCRFFLWQASGWSECRRKLNATEMCGNGTGLQTRNVTCEKDPGYPADHKYCSQAARPQQSRNCSAPCPQDCALSAWSPWTRCSSVCIHHHKHNRRRRWRQVIRLPMYGGADCSGNLDKHGTEVQYRKCKKACHRFKWKMGQWGRCHIHKRKCGHGVQSRNVTCLRKHDNKHVPGDYCHEYLRGHAPPHQRACFQPCRGDCGLSDWSEFSQCSQTCGDQPGHMTRTRKLLFPDVSLSPAEQCPHVSPSQLEQTAPCGNVTCHKYTWDVGNWTSCVTHHNHAKDPCGHGVQKRSVLCLRQDGLHVPLHHCEVSERMPARHQPCNTSCPQRCIVGPWSNWTSCSMLCGEGIKSRIRIVLVSPSIEGRQCPHLVERIPCVDRACKEFEWEISEWSTCKPYYNFGCGRGTQSRSVRCPAGPAWEDKCRENGTKPKTKQPCFLPCIGDCVVSEWSPFGLCSCPANSSDGFRNRTRQILRHNLPSATHCGALSETVGCRCEEYRIEVGPWTSCQLAAGSGIECGEGVRKRTLNCLDSRDDPVDMNYCTGPLPSDSTPCSIPCPRDCVLSGWSPWAPCSASCGMNAMKTRVRAVLVQSNRWGQSCPPAAELVQNTICHMRPCYTYEWHRSEWGTCDMEIRGCGNGSQSRTVQCVRNDGKVVPDIYCIMRGDNTTVGEMTADEKIREDLHTSRPCGRPCPGDCVVSSWSQFGPCFRNCSDQEGQGFQVRSRAVIKPPSGGQDCPDNFQEFRPCPLKDAKCPIFYWQPTSWSRQGTRQVSCSSQTGLIVTGGCTDHTKPSTIQNCTDTCGLYAYCLAGQCRCRSGFRGDGQKCLPDFGCMEDSHCVVNHTHCHLPTKQCTCWDNSVPGTGFKCPPAYRRPDVERAGPPDHGLEALFVYVLIGCLCLLLLIGIMVVLLVMRCRQQKPMQQRTFGSGGNKNGRLSPINNLDSKQHRNNHIKADSPQSYKYNSNSHSTKNWPAQKRPSSPYSTNLAEFRDNDQPNTPPPAPLFTFLGKSEDRGSPNEDVFGYDPEKEANKPFLDDQDYVPMYAPKEYRQEPVPLRHGGSSPDTQVVSLRRPDIRKSDTPRLSTFKPELPTDALLTQDNSSDSGRASDDSGSNCSPGSHAFDRVPRPHGYSGGKETPLPHNDSPKPKVPNRHSSQKCYSVPRGGMRISPPWASVGRSQRQSPLKHAASNPNYIDAYAESPPPDYPSEDDKVLCDELVAELQNFSAKNS